MQDWGWTVFPLLIYGIWLFQFFKETGEVRSTLHTIQKRKQLHGVINDLDNVDLFTQTSILSSGRFVVCVWRQRSSDQDDHKGKKPDIETCFQNIQSCSWLVVWQNQFGPKIQIKYIDTKIQLADMLTKGNFTRDEWNHLLCLFSISNFSSTNCSEVMSKRTQKRFRWRKSHSKIEADDEFSFAMQRKDSWSACLYCITKPGENQIWKSITSELVERAASKNRENCQGRWLIKLLTVECWQELVFSRVEIWWSDGSKNRETCQQTTTQFVYTAHGQIYY